MDTLVFYVCKIFFVVLKYLKVYRRKSYWFNRINVMFVSIICRNFVGFVYIRLHFSTFWCLITYR